jgi:hypothetical protein
MSLNRKQYDQAILGLGVGPLWRAHPALQCTVVRRVIDGTEQRVTLRSPAARRAFLRAQSAERKILAAKPERLRKPGSDKWLNQEL